MEKYDFTEYFKFNKEEQCWVSKKKQLGAGTGDDASLYIYLDENSTHIWWRENRGYERTIFDGKKLETKKEVETLFQWLGINNYKIFK